MRGMRATLMAVLALCAASGHCVDAAQPRGRTCIKEVSWRPPASHQNASVGQQLNINLEEFPKGTVCTWSRGARNTNQTLIGSDSTVLLPLLSESDSDEYTVSCEPSAGLQFPVTLTLVVHSQQECLATPQLKLRIPARPGSSPELQCVAEGFPPPSIRWFEGLNSFGAGRNGKSETSTPQRASTEKSSDYSNTPAICCARNTQGEQCTQLYDYDMDLAQREEDEAPTVTLGPGQSLLLRCRTVDPMLQDQNLEWQSDVMENRTAPCPSSAKDQICIKDDIARGADLLYLFIESVTEKHSGRFTCTNKRNQKSKSVQVRVTAEEFLSVQVEKTRIISPTEAQNYCLRANVSSHPPLLHCVWESPADGGPRSPGPQCPRHTRPWKSRTLELCGQLQSGEYHLRLEAGGQTQTTAVPLCVTADEPMVNLNKSNDVLTCETTVAWPGRLVWMTCLPSNNLSCRPSDSKAWQIPVTSQQDSAAPASQFCHTTLTSVQKANLSEENFMVRCCFRTVCSEALSCVGSAPAYQPITGTGHSADVSLGLKVSCALLFLGFALLSAALLVCSRKKRPQYQSQLQMIQMVGPNDNDYIYINFKDFEYDQKWEFPRENLELGTELGSGDFGMVVQATAYGINMPGESQQVAVKMLKEKHQEVEKEALMSELKMLTHIGHHANVVNLLGACTDSGPTYLIFQYCCYGDLLNYLKNNRERYNKSVTEAFTKDRFSSLYSNLKPGDLQSSPETYVEMHPSTTRGQEHMALVNLNSGPMDTCEGISEDESEELQALTYNDLLSFAYQVAKGMEFLSQNNCIHRDLAARNVLVTKGRVVKIGDFGLARNIDNDSNYVVKGNVRLPVKWMAPESIFQGMYTMQSDVWAYGILLWEIFSLGVTPYTGVKVDNKFYCMIERGFKMECPYYASESLYRMMCRCWELEPGDRPPFSKLLTFMEDQLTDMAEKLYHNVDLNSNDSINQSAAATMDISALTKEKDDQTQSQNQYCKAYATGDATATDVSDSEDMTSEDKPLKAE